MTIAEQISRNLREVHFGGNWTDSCLKEQLDDLTWEEAVTKVGSLNSIATLVYHMNYYIVAVTKVLQGKPLNASDKLSFDCPSIQSGKDWEQLMDRTWKDAEIFADLLRNFPDDKLLDLMADEKYGSYYRNFQGIVEHFHYHLGQIALIKKIIRKNYV